MEPTYVLPAWVFTCLKGLATFITGGLGVKALAVYTDRRKRKAETENVDADSDLKAAEADKARAEARKELAEAGKINLEVEMEAAAVVAKMNRDIREMHLEITRLRASLHAAKALEDLNHLQISTLKNQVINLGGRPMLLARDECDVDS